MTISQAHKQLKDHLVKIYDAKEAMNIINLVLENISGLSRSERLVHRNTELTENQLSCFKNFSAQLIKKKPLQYVLHEAWFAGMKFYVNENVLIPRPETEELVSWIREDFKNYFQRNEHTLSILDIGTGSGCIAIALKKLIPVAKIQALDIDENAIIIASENARSNKVEIDFFVADILQSNTYTQKYNAIVSNPPYIPLNEKKEMDSNVTDYEPSLALFVPDDDPLKFYDAISTFATKNLIKNGSLYFEIHENFKNEVFELLRSKNFESIEIRKDMQGKNRMMKACLRAY